MVPIKARRCVLMQRERTMHADIYIVVLSLFIDNFKYIQNYRYKIETSVFIRIKKV